MYSSILSLTSVLDEDGWSMPCPSHFTPGKDPVLNVQKTGCTLGPVWLVQPHLSSKYSPHHHVLKHL